MAEIIRVLIMAVLLVAGGVSLQAAEENANPRLSDPDPAAWKGLPMAVVVSDFRHSDGIFTSFICDELRGRLSTAPLKSLQALQEIDKNERQRLFAVCLSPEGDDPSAVTNAVSGYAEAFPVLVGEITDAAKQ